MTTQTLLELQVNGVYYINTSHEREKPYLYEGVMEERHRFFKGGAIRDTMRRILVESHNLIVDGNSVGIRADLYKVDSISKDENFEEYEKLEQLWRSKNLR